MRPQSGNEHTTIAVTGMGVASAAGCTPDALWRSAVGGVSPATRFSDDTEPDAQLPARPIPICAINDFTLPATILRHANQLDRSAQLALHAALYARHDARLPMDSVDQIVGVITGTSRGPAQKSAQVQTGIERGTRRVRPIDSLHTTLASLSGAVASQLNATGPCFTVCGTCASAGQAIMLAAQQLLLGTADVMIAGGSDAPLCRSVLEQLTATGILGSHDDPRCACRPFDLSRDGTIPGEGAAFLVLETLTSARARGATVHALLTGWGMANDPARSQAPETHGEALHRAMSQALTMAGRAPGALGYINLHGTGTVLNDLAEARAVRQLLGETHVPAGSTKPITGHCLGATPALEAVISIMALQHGLAPPNINCAHPDPACALDLILGEAQPLPSRCVLSNDLGFWGNNIALLFESAE